MTIGLVGDDDAPLCETCGTQMGRPVIALTVLAGVVVRVQVADEFACPMCDGW